MNFTNFTYELLPAFDCEMTVRCTIPKAQKNSSQPVNLQPISALLVNVIVSRLLRTPIFPPHLSYFLFASPTGSETPQFGCEFNCWISTKSFPFAWQTETFRLEWKSANWFATRRVQGHNGEALGKMIYVSFNEIYASFWNMVEIESILQELKELKCRNCNIMKVNPQVYNLLPQLGVLDLGDNQVSRHFF